MFHEIINEPLQEIDVIVGGTKRGVATVTKQFADLAGGVAVINMDPALFDWLLAGSTSGSLSYIHRPEVDFFQPVFASTPRVPSALLEFGPSDGVSTTGLGVVPEALGTVAAGRPARRDVAVLAGLACGILAVVLATCLGARYRSHSRRHSGVAGGTQ